MRLSDFQERPRFFVSAKVEHEMQVSNPVIDKFQLGQLARDLNRLVERSKFHEVANKPKLKRKSRQRRF
jgi:hypothetical protein